MKKYIYLLIVASFLISMFIPYDISADEGIVNYSNVIGVKEVKDNHTDIVYTGRHWQDEDGDTLYEYKATIHQAPIYNDDGTPVDCRWYGSKGSYYIKDNVFSVSVTGAKTDVTYQGQTSSWNPVVIVDNKEYTAIGDPKIINDPNNENYIGNVLEWDYGICKRQLRVIEGLIQDQWIFDKDPQGTVWIRDNATKSKEFTWAIAPYAYDADGNSIAVNEYKQVSAKVMAEAKYPVTIDPTEVFVTSASDGWIYGSHFITYATAQGAVSGIVDKTSSYFAVGQYKSSSYYVYRGFVYFDTSSIPDGATISAANLSLYGWSDHSVTNFDITVQSGMPTYPHDPLVEGDYDKTHYAGSGGTFGTAGFSTAGYNNLSLDATGMGWIEVTGTTKFCLRSSRDIAVTAVTGEEFVYIYSYEKGAGYRPTLYVTYSSTEAPTITTNDATYVTNTEARLNAYLDADGGEECDVWFQFINSSCGAAPANTSVQSGIETGEYIYEDVTLLTKNCTYCYTAWANNSEGATNGSIKCFTTYANVSAPTDASCSASSNVIYLSWTKGLGTSITYIRWKVGSYPTDVTDGNLIGNITINSYTHTGLISGLSYYYRMWGYEGGNYSTSNVSTFCTTTAGYGEATTNPIPTIDDSSWYETPNGSALSTNPLYPLGNDIASATGVPQGVFWMGTGFLILILIAIFIYKYTRKLDITLIAIIVLGIIMSTMGLFPMWTMIVLGTLGIGFGWKELR